MRQLAILIQNWQNIAKKQISDNPTEKIEIQTIVPTQSHRVSWGPGVFDANLPVDESACRCMCNQSLCGFVKTEMFGTKIGAL